MADRGARAGVEDRWHRDPRKGEQVSYPADAAPGDPVWCMDSKHGTPGKLVCTGRHGQGMRWQARWVGEGAERSKSFARKGDAEEFVKQVTADVVTGAYVDPKRSAMTFRTVADEWMASRKASVKASTYAGDESLLRNTVLPRWGDAKLSDITHADIQQWVTWLTTSKDARRPRTPDKTKNETRKPLSARRAVQAHQVVTHVLAYAMQTKRLATNPAIGIKRPRVIHKRDEALSHDQIKAMAAAAGDAGPILLTLAYTGLRFGELAALRVSDVDLTARRINIDKAVSQVTGIGLVEDTPKTHQIRKVPILTTPLADTLKSVTEGREPTEYLFPAPDGGPMRNSYFRWRFDVACKDAGVTGVSIKTLRHTAGSLAFKAGATVPVTQQLLGHAKASTTLDVYSHMLPDDFDNLALAMDKAVGHTATPR